MTPMKTPINLQQALDWQAPDNWLRIETIDAHTGGEPLRVVLAGWPDCPGVDVLARRRHAQAHLEPLRRALMWEPRGHADMYGCVIMPPVREDSHFAVLFTHNEGYSSMCGHGIIAVTTVALTCGLLPFDTPEVRIDSPAGLIVATPQREQGRVSSVRFRCVPSWVVCRDQFVDVEGLGRVRYDIAFGGAYYAYVDADALRLRLLPENTAAIIDAGMAIKHAVMAATPLQHPEHDDLAFLYGTIFISKPEDARHHSRNVCVFADGEVDRSPTGTGVSGRIALHVARGDVAIGETIRIESLVGSCFDVCAREPHPHHGRAAIIPEVQGSAHITGRHSFLIDPQDAFREGFLIR